MSAHTHTQALTIIPSSRVCVETWRTAVDVQVEPDYHNHPLNLTFKCLTTRSAKRGQMYDRLQKVVGPTFRFLLNWIPQGTLNIPEVIRMTCASNKCLVYHPFEFHMWHRIRPLIKDSMFSLVTPGPASNLVTSALTSPSVLLLDSWWFVFYVTTVWGCEEHVRYVLHYRLHNYLLL